MNFNIRLLLLLFVATLATYSQLFATSKLPRNGLLQRASEQYAKRDYTEAGIEFADSARYNYERVISRQKENLVGLYAAARMAEVENFLASAQSSEKRKRQIYLRSFADAERALGLFYKKYGRRLKGMPLFAQKVYTDLAYQWAVSIRGWVNVTRGRDSRHWKQIEKRFKRADDFGFQYLNYYGMNQLLSTKKRARISLLSEAYDKTRVADTLVSKSGKLTMTYAQKLYQTGAKPEAIAILQQLIKIDPAKLAHDLVPENQIQSNFFDFRDRGRSMKLMKALDSINIKMGSNTLKYAAVGLRQHQGWKTKFKHRSQSYTTNWNQLLEAG